MAQRLRPLVDRFGRLVTWDELYHHMWPGGPASGRSALSRVARLRSRLRPVGLTITTVRTRGVILDHADDIVSAELSGTTEEH
jgi:DNA-binding winged helix-turn-helix (wHTH) protein